MSRILRRGLDFSSPRRAAAQRLGSDAAEWPEPQLLIAPEAVLGDGLGADFRVDPVVSVGDVVAQGDVLLRSRRDPRLALTAPMAGQVARIDLGPGRRLSAIEIFHDGSDARASFDVSAAGEADGLRALMQQSGLWLSALRARPGGRVADPDETPAAIFVAAADTRPGAVPPRVAIRGMEQAFRRGLAALTLLTPGAVHLIQDDGRPLAPAGERVAVHHAGPLHPAGLLGGHVLRHRPAGPEAVVWQIEAQDVAALGTLLETGYLPETRVVSVVGEGLRAPRLLRTQPGADLRALVQGALTPGPRRILAGDLVSGVETRNLRPSDRLVTVEIRAAAPRRDHWFRAALGRASRPVPVIPTAAIEQAVADEIPAVPLLRALGAGDDEAAIRLGALSLLEEDLGLADYVTASDPRHATLLRALLDRHAAEAGT